MSCYVCNEPTELYCCGIDSYCSTECHKKDWKRHRLSCLRLPLKDCHFCGEISKYVDTTDKYFCSSDCYSYFYTLHAHLQQQQQQQWPLSSPRHWLTTNQYSQSQQHYQQQESIYDIINRTGGFPVHCAHRGGGSEFGPENTMYTFRRSVQHKARLLELDLRMTRDKHLVILHWPIVNVTTDGSGFVSNYTLAELQKLDAAHTYPELRGTGIRVPTLREFMDEFAAVPDLLFMLDFKDDESMRVTMQFILPYNIGNRIILGAVLRGLNTTLFQLRETPRVPICTDIIQTFEITLAYMTGLLDSYRFVHDIYGFILMRSTSIFWGRGLVDAIHARNQRVLVTGPDLSNPERLRECIAYGVDFIITDRSDILNIILEQEKHAI